MDLQYLKMPTNFKKLITRLIQHSPSAQFQSQCGLRSRTLQPHVPCPKLVALIYHTLSHCHKCPLYAIPTLGSIHCDSPDFLWTPTSPLQGHPFLRCPFLGRLYLLNTTIRDKSYSDTICYRPWVHDILRDLQLISYSIYRSISILI